MTDLSSATSIPAAALLAVLSVASSMAYAQTAGEEPKSTGIEEIVVTAERRESSAKDVPLSVSAISADTLESFNITNVQSIAQLTPSMSFGTVAVYGQPFIRGIGSELNTPGGESSVALYVDGIYQARNILLAQALNNVERVEVLKGPQGTLYGRNATGGAISIITKTPEPGFGAKFSATAGNGGLVATNARITGGTDILAGSISAYTRQTDGFYRNLITGNKVDDRDDYGAMGKVVWNPTDDSSLTLALDISRLGGMYGSVTSQLGTPGVNVAASAVPGAQFSAEPFRTYTNDEEQLYIRVESKGASANWRTRFDGFDLVLLGGYRDLRTRSATDADSSSAGLIYFNQYGKGETYQMASGEAQLISNGTGPLSWLVGAVYLEDRAHNRVRVVQELTEAIPGLVGLQVFIDDIPKTRSSAVYGEVGYKFGEQERWNVKAGGRWVDETKSISDASLTLNFANGALILPPTLSPNVSKSWDDVIGNASISYKISDDSTTYLRFSQGFKSGAFSANSPEAPPADPESIDAIELGIKSEIMNGLARWSAAAFFMKAKDLQVNRIGNDGGSLFQNAANAEVRGVEAEITAAPATGLILQASLGYLDTEYTNYPNAQAYVPCADYGIAVISNCIAGAAGNPAAAVPAPDLSGKELIRAPKLTGALLARYEMPLSKGTLAWDGMVSYTDNFFFDPINRVEQGSYALLDASVTYRTNGERWWISAWGKNLSDENYLDFVIPTDTGDFGHYAEPRTYGLTIGLEF